MPTDTMPTDTTTATATPPPDTSPIFGVIRQTRRALRSSWLASGAALTLGLGLGTLAAVCLIDLGSPLWPWARLLGLLTIVVPTTWAIVAKVIVPLFRRLGPVTMARKIEGHLPGIHNRLVSCIDLSRPERDRERASAFFARLVKEALERIKAFRPAMIVDWPKLRRAAIFAAASLVAFGVTLGVFSDRLPTAMARIMNPFADIPPATGVVFTVSPGDAKSLRGEDVSLDVTVERGDPSDLRVELTRLDGQGGTIWYDLSKREENRWSLRLAGFESSFSYRVHGGGTWSHKHTITMLDRPALTGLAAAVYYPKYMAIPEPRPSASQAGDVTGPEGSAVEVVVESTGDVRQGEIQWLDAKARQVAVADRAERVWQLLEFVPPGMSPEGPWQWDYKLRGRPVHFDPVQPGPHGHRLTNVPTGFRILPGESLFAYVYIPSDKVPETLALQWHDGAGWEHRAYWGADKLGQGQENTPSRRKIGPMPPAGDWVRLEVPAALVGMENKELRGISFDAVGGQPLWHRAGTVPPSHVEMMELVVAKAYPMTHGEGGTWSGRFPLERNGSYRVELKNELGYANKTMKEAKVSAIPDLPPQVVLERPGADLVLAAPAKVPLVLSAYDDFGLAEIVVSVQKGDSGGFVGRPVKHFEKPARNETVVTSLDLVAMELKPGEHIRYRVEARDRKGQSAQTQEYVVRIANDPNAADTQLTQFEKTQDGFQEKLAKLIADQAKVREAVKALPAKYEPLKEKIEAAAKAENRPAPVGQPNVPAAQPEKPPANLDPEAAKMLAELRQEMAKIAAQEEQNANLAQQVANDLKAAADNAATQKLLPPQIADGLKAAQEAFPKAAVDPLQSLTAAMKAGADANRAAPDVNAINAAVAQVQQDLEAMKARLDALAKAEAALKADPTAAVDGLKRDQERQDAAKTAEDLSALKDFLAKMREELKGLENKENQVLDAAKTAPELLLPDVQAKQGEVEKAADAKIAQAKEVRDAGALAKMKAKADFPKAPYVPDAGDALVPPEEEDAEDADMKGKADSKKAADAKAKGKDGAKGKADEEAEADPKDSMPGVEGKKAKLDPRFTGKVRPVPADQKVTKDASPENAREEIRDRGEQTLSALTKAEGQVTADQDALAKMLDQLGQPDAAESPETNGDPARPPTGDLMNSPEMQKALAMAARLKAMRSNAKPTPSPAQPHAGQPTPGSPPPTNPPTTPPQPIDTRSELAKLDPNTRTILLKMPPRVREELLQGMKEEGPEGYGKFIQDYFKRLSEVKAPN